jgi:hypothetical protein
MNPTKLIRCLAATLAAGALLSAQSAPTAPQAPQAPKARSDGKAADRMQVRLAEVIAMLEEDDLSPEQRAQAKKKLQEIVAKLRETPAPSMTSPSGLAPAGGAATGATPPTPRPPRAARTPGSEAVVLTPQEKAPEGRIVEKRAGREGEPPTMVYRTEGGDYRVARPVEGLKGGVYRIDGDRVVRVDTDKGVWESGSADVEKLQAEAKKLRAEAEAMRTKIRAMAEHDDDDHVEARKLGAARVLLDKSRTDADDAAKANQRARTRDQAAESEVRGLRAYEVGKAPNDEVRGRVAPSRAQRSATSEATPNEVAPTRGRKREAAADGDDDIKKLMEDMRNEMREIRELLQQMRKQAQSGQAPRNSNGFDYYSGSGNAVGMGAAAKNWAEARDAFGQQGPNNAWRGALGGATGKDGDAGEGASSGQNNRMQFWTSNGSATSASPFWSSRSTGTTNTEGGANRTR